MRVGPIAFSNAGVVLAEPSAEAPDFCSHNRIEPGIVIRVTPENLNAYHRLLEFGAAPLQMLLDQESKQFRKLRTAREQFALQEFVELLLRGLSAGFERGHGCSRITLFFIDV
jgi:hypothetical protein